MVDSDGDGQVSFTEFYNVSRIPIPAHTDLAEDGGAGGGRSGTISDPGQMDAKAHERHKEITLRNKGAR